MFRNYFKTAFRNLVFHKGYSLINIIGLSIGMATCILILLFVQRELSFEKMHNKANRTYRVLTIDKALGTNNQRVGITMPAFGKHVADQFPEVEVALRLTGGGRVLLKKGVQHSVYAEQYRSATPNFFEFFDYPLISGDPVTALAEPNTLVLTKTLAKSIFGDQDPLNQTVETGSGTVLKISGVLKDLPENTHLEFDALGSFLTVESQARQNLPPNSNQQIWPDRWNLIAMPTYVCFHEGVSIVGFDEKFTQFCRDNDVSENFDITLQPLLDVHLKSTDVIFDPVTNKGDMKNIFIFAAIAFLILIIAAVNYTNLATAKSARRAREVGIRKVVGSVRAQLVLQFLGESLLITLIALFLALPLVQLTLPWLNNVVDASISLNFGENLRILVSLFLLIILIGIISGLYPAFFLANFKPVTVLKGSFVSGSKGNLLRKLLVVFQFSLSIALIVMTIVIQRQMHYIQTKNLGYDREQVMLFDMYDQTMGQNLETFRNELSSQDVFISIAASGNIPGRTFGRTRVRPEGVSDEDIWIWSALGVSPETVPTLGMEIADGRNFERERSTDSSGVVLVNETAIAKLGWEDPVGKRLYFGQQDSIGTQIIGVVKDFHFVGLHQNIEPVVIFSLNRNPGGLLAARIQKGRIQEAVKIAEEKWKQVYPQHPFVYGFMDDEFDQLYRRDMNTSKVVNIFATVAIFIACLGLFSLASHSIEQRTKEIGIRKVVGASSFGITKLILFDFVKLVAFANLFAWPLAWIVSNKWLQIFAYQIKIDFLIFIISAIIALIIAIITVSYHSMRAAMANPVDSLKYE